MGGVIVVDAGRSRSTCLGRDSYIHDHSLGYRHDYFLFYQLPNSNLFTHHMLPRREMSLRNTMAPGSIHLYIRKRYIYLAAFIYFLFILHLSTIIYTTHLLANNEIKGIDNPLDRVGCKWFVHLCATAEDG